MRIITSREDVENLVLGATVLGTGGGGDPNEGLQLLLSILNAGKVIEVMDVSELSGNDLVAVPYYVGTVAPSARSKKPRKISDPLRVAADEYGKVLNREITAFTATEMGGGNTAVAIYIASMLGKPIIDGDMIGRAAPELLQSTANIVGIPLYPAIIVSETGNVIIVKEYSDLEDYEALARYVSILAGRHAVVIDTPMGKEQAERAVVRGTLTLAMKIGEAIREARNKGEDLAKVVAGILGGWVIFRGVVDAYDWRDEGGFLIGNLLIRGSGKWGGLVFRSWIKNEHIMAFLNDKPIVMPPDLIIVMDSNGPVTNDKVKVGEEVAVIGAPAPGIWRGEKGLELFGPRHFGFNFEYVPVEELVKRHGVVEG
jgi:DUF917 family protein